MLPPSAPAYSAPSEVAQPITVLYVEDQEINVLVMQALIALRPGVRLVVAMSGEEGLKLAQSERPRLLLLDLRLPDCHGSDLLRRMRELPGLAHVPAVAVTADVATDIAGSDFAELWPKPLHVPATLRALDQLLALPIEEEPSSAFGRLESAAALRRSLDRSAALLAGG